MQKMTENNLSWIWVRIGNSSYNQKMKKTLFVKHKEQNQEKYQSSNKFKKENNNLRINWNFWLMTTRPKLKGK